MKIVSVSIVPAKHGSGDMTVMVVLRHHDGQLVAHGVEPVSMKPVLSRVVKTVSDALRMTDLGDEPPKGPVPPGTVSTDPPVPQPKGDLELVARITKRFWKLFSEVRHEEDDGHGHGHGHGHDHG